MKCCLTFCFVVLLGFAITQAVPAEPVTKSIETKKPVEKELKKPEVTAETPAIAVEETEESKPVDRTEKSAPAIEAEGIEESKQVDRTKKSASTTFCVEIRPGPSAQPVKVCENEPAAPPAPPAPEPQVPQETHEIHEQPPAPSPTYIHNGEVPFFIIPPNPAEVFISNEPCDPQTLPPRSFLHFSHLFQHHLPSPPPLSPPQQHIIIPSVVPNPWPQIPNNQPIQIPAPVSYPQTPCPPSPCASASGSAPHPHAVLSLYRSAMDGPLSSLDGMQMRSNDASSGMFPGVLFPSGMEYDQNLGSEIVGTSFGRPPLRLGGRPLPLRYPSTLNNRRYPSYIGRCNEQSSLGKSADGTFNDMDTNGQAMSAMKSSGPYGFPVVNDGAMMQTSPQLNEERWNGNNGFNRNMNIPLGSQPLMMSVPRSTMPEKNMDMDGNHSLMHNEMGKREAKE